MTVGSSAEAQARVRLRLATWLAENEITTLDYADEWASTPGGLGQRMVEATVTITFRPSAEHPASRARTHHDDLERALAALWEIRMAAERSMVDDPPGELVSVVKHLAEGGMARHREEAQRLAARTRGVNW
jgi:hypothetical protein